MSDNPYAPPTSNVNQLQASKTAPALWNPNATASWSLLFTPAFGAYLQMLNWRALGEWDRELQSKAWFYVSLVVLGLTILVGLALPESKAVDGLTRMLGFIYLFTWYFVVGKKQIVFVRDNFGDGYPRKPWLKPLLIALASVVGFIFLSGIIGVLIGL